MANVDVTTLLQGFKEGFQSFKGLKGGLKGFGYLRRAFGLEKGLQGGLEKGEL